MHKELIGKTDFLFRSVDTPILLEQVFRLRYQVYCKECHFLNEEDYPNGIEKDKFDPYSVHFVAQDALGLIGTARMIMDSQLLFPLEEHCKDKLYINIGSLDRKKTVEISRLIISKEYRRRVDDGLYYSMGYYDDLKNSSPGSLLRRFRPMAFGIYREIYQESKRRGITHWLALMEKSLYLLLGMHNFIFQIIGQEVDVYGPVKPYIASIDEIEKNVFKKSPDLIRFFAEGLEPIYIPEFLR